MKPQRESFTITKVEREYIEKCEAEIARANVVLGQAQLQLQSAQSSLHGAVKMVLTQHGFDGGIWSHHKGLFIRDREAESAQKKSQEEQAKVAQSLLDSIAKDSKTDLSKKR